MIRNISLLALLQGLALSGGVTFMAINGLAGLALAGNARWATAPIMAAVIGAACATLPASFFMRRFGRRAGFALGALLGMAGAALCALAVVWHVFALLLLGTFVYGGYMAMSQYYRFAAADCADEAHRSRAISLTLAGGILGGFAGPEAAKHTRLFWPTEFSASYAFLIALALLALCIVTALRIPQTSEEFHAVPQRSLLMIARQSSFLVALLCGCVGYAIMNLLMGATPLAMHQHHHHFNDAVWVMQAHVIAMFAPGFFTGALIRRLSLTSILVSGCALYLACIAIALHDVSLLHFWWALVLLGVGWNFLFVGGTILLTQTYRASEKTKVQGFNDFTIYASQAISALTSGMVMAEGGWSTLNRIALPFVLLALLGIALFAYSQRKLNTSAVTI